MHTTVQIRRPRKDCRNRTRPAKFPAYVPSDGEKAPSPEVYNSPGSISSNESEASRDNGRSLAAWSAWSLLDQAATHRSLLSRLTTEGNSQRSDQDLPQVANYNKSRHSIWLSRVSHSRDADAEANLG